ncbi:MAG TPA: glycosyltransferase [Gemmatimonadales bacterium]|jgi:glycosyltransferase involved in cell wall biosynthesis|nr:glycosyltransferase [Gemmatimonadales bacterium]
MLPLAVVHYSADDPRSSVGGVQRFARNLERIFAEVRFLTPRSRDRALLLQHRIPVICDNQLVRDWPVDYPLIGFQHGVAAVKFAATRSFGHWRLARAQRRAAARPNTLWVACAEWVGTTFAQLYGNGAAHVVYYPVDTERFDGQLANTGSRLILHDARTRHKGKHWMPRLQRAFPPWRFEPLDCPPELVPERMRQARAFVHLSSYEGNSLVCGEAMAMNLPCLLTRVGLLRDADGPREVWALDPRLLRGTPVALFGEVERFLASLPTRSYQPREWILAHATLAHAEARWRQVLLDFQALSGWELGLSPEPQGQR